MTSLTIRDLRQRWPEAEKALETEDEILITRDGKPVAKLIRYIEPKKKRRRFDSVKHLAKMKQIMGGRVFPSIDDALRESRKGRFLRE
jgi:antitoxin (DNA-binding transcriptional repressor) of toxin-antitoxin stability system